MNCHLKRARQCKVIFVATPMFTYLMIFSPVQSPKEAESLQHQETKSIGGFPASSSDQDAAKKGFLISTEAIASQSSSLEMEEVEVELS